MRLVADTGPLHYLVLIEHIAVLGALFDCVCVPDAVRAELDHPETPEPVREWIASPPTWFSVRSVKPDNSEFEALDAGERDVLSLAGELSPGLVLMDDRAGVAAARGRGLTVTGTLGLLFRGASIGLLDLPTSLDRLKLTNFHYTQALFDRVLARFESGANGP